MMSDGPLKTNVGICSFFFFWKETEGTATGYIYFWSREKGKEREYIEKDVEYGLI